MNRDDVVITLFGRLGPEPPPRETRASGLTPSQQRKATMTPEQLEAIGCTPDGYYRPGRAPKREIPLPDGEWYQLLPYGVAKLQHAWETRMRVLRARRAGAKFTQMAIKLGVTTSRVRQMYEQALWDECGGRSPVEQYMDWDILELHALANRERYSGHAEQRRMKHARAFYNRRNPDWQE